MKRGLFAISSFGILAIALGLPVTAQAPAFGFLHQLDPGLWEVRLRGDDAPARKLCLGDVRNLIQLRHQGKTCSSFVVSETGSDITVQYTCRGQGYGRTHVRRETNRLIQLDTQGIADGSPYAFAAEARRVGSCGG